MLGPQVKARAEREAGEPAEQQRAPDAAREDEEGAAAVRLLLYWRLEVQIPTAYDARERDPEALPQRSELDLWSKLNLFFGKINLQLTINSSRTSSEVHQSIILGC